MNREYHLQHKVIVEDFFNNAHDFEKWYNNPQILKDYIYNAYEKISNLTNKTSDKADDWIKLITTVKNGFHYIVIDFGESERADLCSKIILANYRKPRYFTVERGEDYLYGRNL